MGTPGCGGVFGHCFGFFLSFFFPEFGCGSSSTLFFSFLDIYLCLALGCVSFEISGRSEEFLARLVGGEAVDTLSRIGKISDLAWVSHIDLKVKSGTCSTKRSEKTDIGNREDTARREQSSQYLPSA